MVTGVAESDRDLDSAPPTRSGGPADRS